MSINHLGNRLSPSVRRLLIAVLVLAAHPPATAGAQALLEISSPAAGSIVNPGQTMTVVVTSPANAAFLGVGVIGESPIGMSTVASALPAQFSFDIPADITCRRYQVAANGRTSSGQDVETSITIDVERSDMPSSIRTTLSSLRFEAPGGYVPLDIMGSFSDGKVLDVTQSSYVAYTSSNPAIATVTTWGQVTAVAAGDALITVTYGPPAQGIVTTIPVHVPAPIFLIAPAQLDFGAQNVGNSTSLSVTLTNTTTGELGIFGVTTTGDYSTSNTCSSASPLAVNATCTITVTFAPLAIGSNPGSVRIANDFTSLPVAFRVGGLGAPMKCDANGDGFIDLADLLIIRNAIGQVASGPDDPRDGNGDGAINVSDIRYCSLRLTLP